MSIKEKVIALAVAVLLLAGCSGGEKLSSGGKSDSGKQSSAVESHKESLSSSSSGSTGENPQEIVSGLILRGVNVGYLFSGGFQVKEGDASHTTQLIDTQTQYSPQLLELAQQLKTVEDLKNYVYDTFDRETADTILSFCFNNRYQLYEDGEGGLAMNTGIGPTSLMMAAWLPDTMTIVTEEPDKLVAEMEIEQFNSLPEAGTERRQLTVVAQEGGWRLTKDYIIDRELKQQAAPGEQSPAIENGQINYQEVLRLYGAEDAKQEDGSTAIMPTATSLYYYSEAWGPDAPLPPDGYFYWFFSSTMKEEYEYKQTAYKSPLGKDQGWFFPQEVYEGRIQQYFDVSVELLRQHQWYRGDLGGYQMQTGGGRGDTPKLYVDTVDTEGDLRRIHVILKYSSGTEERRTLTIRVAGDNTFKFAGCTMG